MTTVIPPGEVLAPRKTPKPPKARAAFGRAGAGRFGVLNAFIDASLRGVSGSAAKVWMIIFRDTKPNGLARIGDSDLARRAGVSQRTVRRGKRELIALGLLVVVRLGGLNRGASVYRLHPLKPGSGVPRQPVKSGHGLRTPVSAIPEWDQKGRPRPIGPDAPMTGNGGSGGHR